MSPIYIVVVVTIVAALLGLWAYRRATTPASAPSGKSKIGNQSEQWGVRISAPERACPQVREILGKEFPISGKPPLPLLGCPFPQQCECGYVKLFDRRKGERRAGHDRRLEGQRFEDKTPRRSGKDRRKRINWF